MSTALTRSLSGSFASLLLGAMPVAVQAEAAIAQRHTAVAVPQVGRTLPPVKDQVSTEVSYAKNVAAAYGDKTYFVLDKKMGKIYLFDKGRMLLSEQALTGASLKDQIPDATYEKPLGDMTVEDAVTPAGRFTVSYSPTGPLGETLDINEVYGDQWKISIHGVWLGNPNEHRAERLASHDPGQSHISHMCINVSHETLRKILAVVGHTAAAPIYVLPQDRDMTQAYISMPETGKPAKPPAPSTVVASKQPMDFAATMGASAPQNPKIDPKLSLLSTQIATESLPLAVADIQGTANVIRGVCISHDMAKVCKLTTLNFRDNLFQAYAARKDAIPVGGNSEWVLQHASVSETPAAAQQAEQAAPQPEPSSPAPVVAQADPIGDLFTTSLAKVAGNAPKPVAQADPIGDLLSRNILGKATGNPGKVRYTTSQKEVVAAMKAAEDAAAAKKLADDQAQAKADKIKRDNLRAQQDAINAKHAAMDAQVAADMGEGALKLLLGTAVTLGAVGIVAAAAHQSRKKEKGANHTLGAPNGDFNFLNMRRKQKPIILSRAGDQENKGAKLKKLSRFGSELAMGVIVGGIVKLSIGTAVCHTAAVGVGTLFTMVAGTVCMPAAAAIATAVVSGMALGAVSGLAVAALRTAIHNGSRKSIGNKRSWVKELVTGAAIGAVGGGVISGVLEAFAPSLHIDWSKLLSSNSAPQVPTLGGNVHAPLPTHAPTVPTHAPLATHAPAPVALPTGIDVGHVHITDTQLHSLPDWVQKLATSHRPEDMARFCKEASFQLINHSGGNADAAKSGLELLKQGVDLAQGLSGHHAEALKTMLNNDWSYEVRTGLAKKMAPALLQGLRP